MVSSDRRHQIKWNDANLASGRAPLPRSLGLVDLDVKKKRLKFEGREVSVGTLRHCCWATVQILQLIVVCISTSVLLC